MSRPCAFGWGTSCARLLRERTYVVLGDEQKWFFILDKNCLFSLPTDSMIPTNPWLYPIQTRP
jgi:hypothetical protein